MKVYIAAPLFWEGELEYNRKISTLIEEAGHTVLLPQEYKGNTYELYLQCIEGIDECDVMVALLNGTDADSGTSFECGYARAQGKFVIGFRSDKRENHVDGLNLMLRYGVNILVQSMDAMMDAIGLAEAEENDMEPLE